jgi:hypothetical protein
MSRHIKVSIKSDKNNRYFTWRPIIHFFLSYLALLFLEWEMRNVSDESCRENQNTKFIFQNRAVCEIMWKNTVEPDKPHMTKTWRMRIACWIPTSRNTHSEYIILTAFPLQQWLHECATMLRYTYIACLAPDYFFFFFFFFFSSTTPCEFWLAQLFLSIASSLAPFVSSSALPSSSNHFSRHLPILVMAFLSVVLHTVSIYICS